LYSTPDGLSERINEIGIFGAAAVVRPPTGIHSKLHKVGEPSNLLSIGRFTAGQGAKLIQIAGSAPLEAR
jgi:hypothetical protein